MLAALGHSNSVAMSQVPLRVEAVEVGSYDCIIGAAVDRISALVFDGPLCLCWS